MVFVFPIGWSNYTPYLAKEIIGNTLRKCSAETRVIDLNNHCLWDLICRINDYLDKDISESKVIEQLEILTSIDSIENFDTFLLAKESLDCFLLTYSQLDRTVSISLDGISFIGVTDNIYNVNLNNILDYVINRKSILLNKYFSNDLISSFCFEDIVAFSVTSLHQFVTSLYLADILKKESEKIKIIIGGNYLSRIYGTLVEDGRVFKFVDYLVAGCGEDTLPLLYKHIKTNSIELRDIPDIAYFDSEANVAMWNHLEHKESIHESAFGLENCKTAYFLPKKVVPIYITRGCAWKKCAFCSIPNASGKFRVRNIDDVVADIKQYVKYGISNFSFVDETLTPFLMKRLSGVIQSEGLDIRWGALARFDSSLDLDICKEIYDSGCRRLQFGLESYNKNILLKMNKGIDYNEVKTVIMHCIQSGISVNLFCMIGFPGETEREAKNTVKFVLDVIYEALYEYGVLVTADFSAFLLDINSNVFYHQEQFGIESEAIDNTSISLYSKYGPLAFDKNAVVYEAEQQYSKLIYDYFGNNAFKLKEPLYISETYWFLKACQMEKKNDGR